MGLFYCFNLYPCQALSIYVFVFLLAKFIYICVCIAIFFFLSLYFVPNWIGVSL